MFTYDPLLTEEKDQVRFLIQDTNCERPMFQDEEIEWMLSVEANIYQASAMLCDSVVARVGNVKSKKVGELKIDYDMGQNYRQLGFQLRSRGLTHQMPYASGISIADKQIQQNDTDAVKPSIGRGLGENPAAPKVGISTPNPLTEIEMVGEIAEFLDFMPDRVTIHPWTGQTVSGASIYSPTGTVYPCRIEMKNHLVVDLHGRTVTARGKVIMGSPVMVDVKDKIVLPSDYTPVSPPIIGINRVPDELGSHHTTLEIG